MKPIKIFSIGSSVFFSEITGFVPRDTDELCIMDDFTRDGTNVIHTHLHGKDVFFYRDMDKNGFIKDALESKNPMRVGKFLVPAFVEYIGLKVNELDQLAPLFDKLDERHKYEKNIMEAYMENGNFILTESQRMKVYEQYKINRI